MCKTAPNYFNSKIVGEREPLVRFCSDCLGNRFNFRGILYDIYYWVFGVILGTSGSTSSTSMFLIALRMLPVVHLSGGIELRTQSHYELFIF